MTDYIVTSVDGKTASDIYKKVIDWIKITYKNPDKVILSTIENEYIRFEGSSETLYALHIVFTGKTYYNTKYQIEISIKDNKYKFDLINMETYMPSSPNSPGRWTPDVNFSKNLPKENANAFYKKDGSLRNLFQYFPDVPTYFNGLNKSLLENISSTATKTSGW